MCQWFALCTNADNLRMISHPILGNLRICRRCAGTVEIDFNALAPLTTTTKENS